MKSAITLFLFELEHCINHMYFELRQQMHFASEKFKTFCILRQNYITDKCDAEKTLQDL